MRTEDRIANAIEHSAEALDQIAEKLDRILILLEKREKSPG